MHAANCEREVDCPWFDPEWLLDNPDFPLQSEVAIGVPPVLSPQTDS
jgi:hypothetical protein